MSLKVKLTSLITTFILLSSLLTVGVFAVKNTSFNVGGNIVFEAKGIEASITRDSYAGFVTTNEKVIGDADGNVLSSFTLDNTMSADQVASKLAPWSGLELAFNEATTATINLTITNTAEEGVDNYLDITATADAITKNNAKVTVANDAGGTTALLEPQQSASFTITFSVIDDGYSASLEGFSVNFDMQKKVLADFPTAVEGVVLTFDTANKTASVTGNTLTANTDIVLPKYVRDAETNTVCAITEIGFSAFSNCTYLTSITIPDSVTKISGFSSCSNLTSITIGSGLTSIGYSAFSGCSSLASIIVDENNSTYDSREDCNAIIATSTNSLIIGGENTVIPNTVTSIGYYAFSGRSNLVSITIPESLTSIGAYAFIGCSNLTNMNYLGDINSWVNISFTNSDANPTIRTKSLTINGETVTNAVIDTATSIKGYAFCYCTNLESVTIGSQVTSIGDYAFGECTSLTTINYTGTQEQWNAITISHGNDELLNAKINYNYTGQ